MVCAGRRVARLEELCGSLSEQGLTAVAVETDVTQRSDAKRLAETAETRMGPVDILVNAAGVMYYTNMRALHEDEWEQQVDVNCKGVMNCIGAVLDGMLARSAGHIVNISSDAGRQVFPGLAVYSATKFFVEALSKGLRSETAGSGLRVTTVQVLSFFLFFYSFFSCV